MSQTPTMSDAQLEYDPQLIDVLLARAAPDESRELDIRMSADPRLSRQHDELRAALGALDSWRDVAAPATLADRVSAKVRGLGRSPRWAPRGVDDNDRVLRLTNFREITAVAAMIVLAVGVGVPSLLQMRERNERIQCSANLAEIGRGLQAYATAFGDNLPFAGWSGRSTWASTGDPGAEVIRNRRHLYPLLTSQNVTTPGLFVCPSTEDVPMPVAQILRRDDFLEERNISYANQNMAGVRPSLRDNPALPILADDNPLFRSGIPIVDLAARGLGLSSDKQNSRAHGGAGQNTLALDGAVKWADTPNCGVNGDNIWTLEKVGEYTGREGPQASTDSHLIK